MRIAPRQCFHAFSYGAMELHLLVYQRYCTSSARSVPHFTWELQLLRANHPPIMGNTYSQCQHTVLSGKRCRPVASDLCLFIGLGMNFSSPWSHMPYSHSKSARDTAFQSTGEQHVATSYIDRPILFLSAVDKRLVLLHCYLQHGEIKARWNLEPVFTCLRTQIVHPVTMQQSRLLCGAVFKCASCGARVGVGNLWPPRCSWAAAPISPSKHCQWPEIMGAVIHLEGQGFHTSILGNIQADIIYTIAWDQWDLLLIRHA